jgi:hypothetical protein
MLEKEFYDWLLKKYNTATANARKANCLNISKYEGDLDQHFEKDTCRSLIEKLSYSTDDEKHNRPAKHKIPISGNVRAGSSTLKQAVNLYVEFKAETSGKPVEEKPKKQTLPKEEKAASVKDAEPKKEEIEQRNMEIGIKEFYNQEQLRDIFRSRLRTQDRTYDFLYFPIRQLSSTVTRRYGSPQHVYQWFDGQIDKMLLCITDNSRIIEFKEIKSLEILDDSSVWVNDKSGNPHRLLTSIVGKNTREPMKATSISDIVIDHVVSFKKILLELEWQLSYLQEIHKYIKSRLYDYDNNVRKAVTQVELFGDDPVNAWNKELPLISKRVQLQLMSKSENERKGED